MSRRSDRPTVTLRRNSQEIFETNFVREALVGALRAVYLEIPEDAEVFVCVDGEERLIDYDLPLIVRWSKCSSEESESPLAPKSA